MNQRYWDKVCETFERMLHRGSPHDTAIVKHPLKMDSIKHLTFLEESLILELLYIEHAKELLSTNGDDTECQKNVETANSASLLEDMEANVILTKNEEETASTSSEKTEPATDSKAEKKEFGPKFEIGETVVIRGFDPLAGGRHANILAIRNDMDGNWIYDVVVEGLHVYRDIPEAAFKAIKYRHVYSCPSCHHIQFTPKRMKEVVVCDICGRNMKHTGKQEVSYDVSDV